MTYEPVTIGWAVFWGSLVLLSLALVFWWEGRR